MKCLALIAITLTATSTACAKKGKETPKAEPVKKEIENKQKQKEEKPNDPFLKTAEIWTSPFELSKNQFIPLGQTGYSFSIYLITALTPDLLSDWDEQKSEGLLQFGAIFDQELAGEESTRSSFSAYTCRTENYLFTKLSQRLGVKKFDSSEAEIYLKTNEGDIAVGRYRKYDGGSRITTWARPLLCEGVYAHVCATRLVST